MIKTRLMRKYKEKFGGTYERENGRWFWTKGKERHLVTSGWLMNELQKPAPVSTKSKPKVEAPKPVEASKPAETAVEAPKKIGSTNTLIEPKITFKAVLIDEPKKSD